MTITRKLNGGHNLVLKITVLVLVKTWLDYNTYNEETYKNMYRKPPVFYTLGQPIDSLLTKFPRLKVYIYKNEFRLN